MNINDKEQCSDNKSNKSDDVSKDINIEMISDDINKTIEAHGKNTFPIDAFPVKIQEIIEEFRKAFNLPVDFYGSTVLAAASCLIGNSFNIKFKEGWYESAAIFMAIVGRSSIGKTPAIDAFLNPIKEIERKLHDQYTAQLKKYELEVAEARENKEKEPDRPVCKELIINDATTESINKALQNNPNGLILYQDELIAFIKSLNRYSKGSDLEYFIGIWKNTLIKVNRKSSDPIIIAHPFMSVIGGIQPSVLSSFADGKIGNGFLARILFAYPEDCQKQYLSDYEPSKEILKQYNNILFDLYNYSVNNNTATDGSWYSELKITSLELSEEALNAYKEWYDQNVDLINQSDDTENSIFGKLDNYCLRFALILELLEAASKNVDVNDISSISEYSILNAIKLTEYFRNTSLKVLRKITNSNPLDDISALQQKVYSKLPDLFKTKDGVELAEAEGMPLRTFHRFIGNNKLFKKKKHGEYEKLY